MSEPYVLNLELCQFIDPDAGSGEEADDEVPQPFVVLSEAVFKINVILLADDIFCKGLLLHTHEA